MSGEVVIALLDPRASGSPDDVLGLWDVASAVDVSFATASSPEPPVWRIDLPADPLRARRSLHAARERATRASEQLSASSDALLEVVAGRARPDSGPSAAERELVAWLGEYREPGPGVSFGARDRLPAGMTEALDAAGELADRLGRCCAPVAHVETCVGDRLLARTGLDWRGNLSSVVSCRPSARDVEVHAAAVDLVRVSRATLLRVVGLAVRGAMLVAAVVALPGGPLLALPAVWRFLNRALREVQR